MGIGQRPQEDAVHDAEDRAVRADPEGEREHSDERERGTLAQLPEGEAHIGSQRIQPVSPFHGSLPLVAEDVEGRRNGVDVTEAAHGFGARGVGSHAGGDVLRHGGLEMKAQFVGDVGIRV